MPLVDAHCPLGQQVKQFREVIGFAHQLAELRSAQALVAGGREKDLAALSHDVRRGGQAFDRLVEGQVKRIPSRCRDHGIGRPINRGQG